MSRSIDYAAHPIYDLLCPIEVQAMLSFTKGKPIALICGGHYDKRLLRLTEDQAEPDRKVEEEDIFDLLGPEDLLRDEAGTRKTLRTIDQRKLERAIRMHQAPIDEHLISSYARATAKLQHQLKKEFSTDSGTLVMLPDPASERVYIAGKSGSGKSCLAALYMNEYLRMFPDRRVYLVSRHEDEKTYAAVPHEVVPLETFEEAEKGERVFELEELANSLVVFDDCDNVQNKKITEGVKMLSDDLISNGRKYGIYVLTLQHQLMNYKETRNILNEVQRVVFFNTATNYHTGRFLKMYAGLDPKQVKRVHDIKSRWTMIDMGVPRHVIHQNGAFIL